MICDGFFLSNPCLGMDPWGPVLPNKAVSRGEKCSVLDCPQRKQAWDSQFENFLKETNQFPSLLQGGRTSLLRSGKTEDLGKGSAEILLVGGIGLGYTFLPLANPGCHSAPFPQPFWLWWVCWKSFCCLSTVRGLRHVCMSLELCIWFLWVPRCLSCGSWLQSLLPWILFK